jgi:hypothetical protein
MQVAWNSPFMVPTMVHGHVYRMIHIMLLHPPIERSRPLSTTCVVKRRTYVGKLLVRAHYWCVNSLETSNTSFIILRVGSTNRGDDQISIALKIINYSNYTT